MTGHPIFAWFYGRLGPRADLRGTADRRRRLLATARGSVLEVGAGTGLNLRHYPATVTEVLAVEPDPHMFRRLALALDQSPVPVQLRRATADALPAHDDSVDTVVCSLVLCSVPDVFAALSEARRVLKPSGRLLFFEHVRALDPRFAKWQDRLEGPWGSCGAGCHPNRDTIEEIEASGFRIEELDRFDEPGAMLAKPHVLGSALPV
jgi:ubiquinone/menaquinone biosynthesis C-methylase UbiE